MRSRNRFCCSFFDNWATNIFATIPGGSNNIAGQPFTCAAGNNARAMHQGAFVWADM
jgi:hypothetical protein